MEYLEGLLVSSAPLLHTFFLTTKITMPVARADVGIGPRVVCVCVGGDPCGVCV